MRCARCRRSAAGSRKRSGSASPRAIVPASTPDVAGIQLAASTISPAARHAAGIASAAAAARRRSSDTRSGTLQATSDLERTVAQPRSEPLYGALRLVAPGTPLREGIDRILQAKMGALIVVGDEPDGAQHLLGRLPARRRVHAAAAVRARQDGRRDHPRLRRHPGRPRQRAPRSRPRHPDHRDRHPPPHRRARRRARSRCRCSRCRRRWASCRCTTAGTSARSSRSRVCSRVPTRRLQILGRYKARLDGVTGALSALEVEDLVTLRDVATVLQRAEMVRRIADEIEGYVVELGDDGRLVELQLEELTGGVEDDRRLVGPRLLRRVRAPLARRRRPTSSPSSPTRTCSICASVAVAARAVTRPGPRLVGAAPRLPACSTRSRACPSRSPTT